jgi:hypothetical protein
LIEELLLPLFSPAVKGQQELNAGGHGMCTLADSRTEHWWPSGLRGG